MLKKFSAGLIFLCIAYSATAGDITYKPINPSFGGNYLNSNHLQSLANAQKNFKEESEKQSTTDRFLSMLQSRLYSSLASQVADAIFGQNAQQSGTIVFNDQQISFFNSGTDIQLTVTDFASGQVTNIVVPTLQSP